MPVRVPNFPRFPTLTPLQSHEPQSSHRHHVGIEELKRDFKPAELTNFILVRVGDYIRKTASYREALPYYDEVIKRRQDNLIKAMLGRGDVYARSTDPAELDKAIADFKEVFKEADDNAEKEAALCGIVQALMAKKDSAAAEQAKE